MGKNALDIALINAARKLFADGIRQFYLLSSDNDFIDIIRELRTGGATVVGLGQINTSEDLKMAYDKFLYFPPAVAKKVVKRDTWVKRIPDCRPIDCIRENLIKAYKKIANKNEWILSTKFSNIWAMAFKEINIPQDHPSKLKNMIKIYHDSFEWKIAGGTLLIRLKKMNSNLEVDVNNKDI